MFFKFLIMIVFLGFIGFGGYTYLESVKVDFMQNEKKLNEKIKILQKTIKLAQKTSQQSKSQLDIEYETIKKRIEDKFKAKEKTLLKKYGAVDQYKAKMKAENKAIKKDLAQKENGLKKLEQKLLKEQTLLKKAKKTVTKKQKDLNSIKLECRIFDLRKIDQAVKDFQKVSYATQERINLLCGFDPSNRSLVNKSMCIKGRRDREKAMSLLSFIDNTAKLVKQGNSYKKYVRTQRYRMKINY